MISRPSARLEVSAAHATVDSDLLLCRITSEKTAYSCNLSHFFWISISLLSVLYLLQYRLDKLLYLSIHWSIGWPDIRLSPLGNPFKRFSSCQLYLRAWACHFILVLRQLEIYQTFSCQLYLKTRSTLCLRASLPSRNASCQESLAGKWPFDQSFPSVSNLIPNHRGDLSTHHDNWTKPVHHMSRQLLLNIKILSTGGVPLLSSLTLSSLFCWSPVRFREWFRCIIPLRPRTWGWVITKWVSYHHWGGEKVFRMIKQLLTSPTDYVFVNEQNRHKRLKGMDFLW